MTNPVPPSYYTTVSNGFIQLRSSTRSGVIQTFGNNIQTAIVQGDQIVATSTTCLLYTSPSPRDVEESRMPSSA